jgi:hypothetical protein
MNLTKKEVKQLTAARAYVQDAWACACIEAGAPTDSKFVVFDQDKPAAKLYNQAAGELLIMRARIRKNVARRERHQAMKDLGLKRVTGALGGVYYE